MQTHPCYPLTDANRAEYERLNAAKAKLATTTDTAERIKLKIAIGDASQNIRLIGMNNELITIKIPKPPTNEAELIDLRNRVQVLETTLSFLLGRVTITESDRNFARQQVAALGADVWREISKDVVI